MSNVKQCTVDIDNGRLRSPELSYNVQKNSFRLKYNAELIYTIGDCDQRCNHTMPKIHLLMNEFLKRVV